MNAPEMTRLLDNAARSAQNLAAIFTAYSVDSVAALSAAVFFEFEGEPALEAILDTGALVKTGDLSAIDPEQVCSLLVCHVGCLPSRLDLSVFASPSEAVQRFNIMAEGLADDEVEA